MSELWLSSLVSKLLSQFLGNGWRCENPLRNGDRNVCRNALGSIIPQRMYAIARTILFLALSITWFHMGVVGVVLDVLNIYVVPREHIHYRGALPFNQGIAHATLSIISPLDQDEDVFVTVSLNNGHEPYDIRLPTWLVSSSPNSSSAISRRTCTNLWRIHTTTSHVSLLCVYIIKRRNEWHLTEENRPISY